MDAEANSVRLQFQATNLDRVVILELNPPKVLKADTLSSQSPNGSTKATATKDEISIMWKGDSHPRSPLMILTLNRFSLEAVEYYQISQIDPRAIYFWTREGKCRVDGRKL
ncbi:MAG: hypothetical protein HEQ37_15645 [Acidovorax sp.]|nr:hypothetical protein [Acidovorax sp.]